MAKQRQAKMQYRLGSLSAMQQLEGRTDEQLLSESRHRAAARAILGSRAAERYDAKMARKYFNEAMVGCHPQERPALRQMMKASLALAERRPDDLRDAVEKLGQTPPSNRQLLILRVMGLLAPAQNASRWVRARGFLLILAIVAALMGLGFGLAQLAALPFGGIGYFGGMLVGLVIVAVALGVLALVGRRRQKKATARAVAARAASSGRSRP